MGGRAFLDIGYESLRMTQEKYEELQQKVENLLGDNLTYFVVQNVQEKDSHGDMDILYVTQPNSNPFEEFQTDRHLYKRNKGLVHVLYDKKYQIDFIPCSEETFEFSTHYFSNNDLGNILGRLLRVHGLSLHHDGIYHIFREGGSHSKIPTRVSTDWNDVLEILELDKAAYSRSFPTFQGMFEWVYASPYWDYKRFKYENLNSVNRKRDQKRKTYNAWLGFCKNSPTKEVLTPPLLPEERFPALVDRLASLREVVRVQQALRSKFNGNVVASLTGLSGKELGVFMSRFVREYPKSELAEMEADQIQQLVLQFPRGNS